MGSNTYASNQSIVNRGQARSQLHLIQSGCVKASFPGGSFQLNEGDIVGMLELTSSCYLLDYSCLEETTLISFSCADPNQLEPLFSQQPNLASSFCRSAVYQFEELLRCYKTVFFEWDLYSSSCQEDYEEYVRIAKANGVTPQELPQLPSVISLKSKDFLPAWLDNFYEGIWQILSQKEPTIFSQEKSVAIGLLGKVSQDVPSILKAFDTLKTQEKTYHHLYFNEKEEDLLGFYTSLACQLSPEDTDYQTLFSSVNRILMQIQSFPDVDFQDISARQAAFQEIMAQRESKRATEGETPEETKNLLSTLLSFAQVETLSEQLPPIMNAYKEIYHSSSDEDASLPLRKELTEYFFQLYQAVFLKCMTYSPADIPIGVKLFMYFGCMDEELVGNKNLNQLIEIAQNMDEQRQPSVYTFYHWLLAIWNGEKEPSRNQYEEDYTDAVHSLKVNRKITEVQEKALLQDSTQRVLYEMNNMFPVANKITHGHPSTYCPIFTEKSVIKPLRNSYLSPKQITDTLSALLEKDFSAFYRQTVYSNEAIGVPREFIHVECLPDFILMPVYGSRGVMWQEIEGKKRTTAARMLLPIFFPEDLNLPMARLMGEFRWEMCKRVQGPRWNDLSERSLTSEYCDYAQFYRKNHDLSADAKERIKNSLQKARNNFKELFILDYLIWVLYESNGSPRLNKVARGILFAYCPFPAEIRQGLSENPLYRELLERYTLSQKKQQHHWELLELKLGKAGRKLPPELLFEKEFVDK